MLIGVTGFIVFTIAGYICLVNWHLNVTQFGKHFDMIITIGSAVCGVLGALISNWLWKWYLIGMGALASSSLTVLAFSALASSIPYSWLWMRTLIIAVMALLGGYLAYRFERPIVIVSTSIVGAVMLFVGLDVFLDTGFDGLLLSLMNYSSSLNLKAYLAYFDNRIYGMIAACYGSALVGVAIQTRFFGHKKIRRQYVK